MIHAGIPARTDCPSGSPRPRSSSPSSSQLLGSLTDVLKPPPALLHLSPTGVTFPECTNTPPLTRNHAVDRPPDSTAPRIRPHPIPKDRTVCPSAHRPDWRHPAASRTPARKAAGGPGSPSPAHPSGGPSRPAFTSAASLPLFLCGGHPCPPVRPAAQPRGAWRPPSLGNPCPAFAAIPGREENRGRGLSQPPACWRLQSARPKGRPGNLQPRPRPTASPVGLIPHARPVSLRLRAGPWQGRPRIAATSYQKHGPPPMGRGPAPGRSSAGG